MVRAAHVLAALAVLSLAQLAASARLLQEQPADALPLHHRVLRTVSRMLQTTVIVVNQQPIIPVVRSKRIISRLTCHL